jgi:nuclear pore complex protein Nup62
VKCGINCSGGWSEGMDTTSIGILEGRWIREKWYIYILYIYNICVYVCMYMCVYIHTMYVHTWQRQYIYVYMFVCVYICIYVSIFKFMCTYVCLCVCAHVCSASSEKTMLDPLKLEVQVIVGHPTWMAGAKFWSSARTWRVFNAGASRQPWVRVFGSKARASSLEPEDLG